MAKFGQIIVRGWRLNPIAVMMYSGETRLSRKAVKILRNTIPILTFGSRPRGHTELR